MSPEVPIIIVLLAIPLYFLVRWGLKGFGVKKGPNRVVASIVISLLISPFLYVGLVTATILYVSYYPTIEFDKNEWVEKTETRYRMSQDIIKSEILVGLTVEEVIGVLGSDYYRYDDSHIAYDLGFVPGMFNIDPDVLDVYFERGKVTRVDQHET